LAIQCGFLLCICKMRCPPGQLASQLARRQPFDAI
jgi:hypothetical protein